jgi:hypothetical protein
MSTAAATREAVREQPFLLLALRAGVVNYTAAAQFLEVGAGDDAVATALRRFADELPGFETAEADVRVRMESGVGLVEDLPDDAGSPLLSIGDAAVVPDAGSMTAVVATGEVDTTALGTVCARLDAEGIESEAAAVAGETLVVVVGRRDGVDALRAVEGALSAVPA